MLLVPVLAYLIPGWRVEEEGGREGPVKGCANQDANFQGTKTSLEKAEGWCCQPRFPRVSSHLSGTMETVQSQHLCGT